MNTDLLSACTQLLAAAGTIVASLVAAYIATLRYRLKLALIAAGRDPDKAPDILSAGPLVLLIMAGISWLFAMQAPQRLANYLMPTALEMDAKSGPVDRSCSKNSDCGTGCSCDRGSCSCNARRPSSAPPSRQQPRRVAELQSGTLCADCLALPWHVQPIETFYSPPDR